MTSPETCRYATPAGCARRWNHRSGAACRPSRERPAALRVFARRALRPFPQQYHVYHNRQLVIISVRGAKTARRPGVLGRLPALRLGPGPRSWQEGLMREASAEVLVVVRGMEVLIEQQGEDPIRLCTGSAARALAGTPILVGEEGDQVW